jgi:hypothetical protein
MLTSTPSRAYTVSRGPSKVIVLGTYLDALRNGRGDGVDAAQATELLPLGEVANVVAEVGREVSIEHLDTVLTALFLGPALVLGEAPELVIEAGVGAGLEVFEARPDTGVALGDGAVVVSQRSRGTRF